jgi:hypothetical protein
MPSQRVSPYESERVAQHHAQRGGGLYLRDRLTNDRVVGPHPPVMASDRWPPPVRPACDGAGNDRRRRYIMRTSGKAIGVAESVCRYPFASQRDRWCGTSYKRTGREDLALRVAPASGKDANLGRPRGDYGERTPIALGDRVGIELAAGQNMVR